MSTVQPTESSSFQSKRKFKQLVAELHTHCPRHADLILQTSIKKQDAARLGALLTELNPSSLLEIGSYCGVSTRWLLSSVSSVSVECVDPWLSNGDVNTEAVFDTMVAPYSARVKKTRAYFGSRNNQAFSVTTSNHETGSTGPGQFRGDFPLFRPTRNYDVVFVDGDHRTSSSIAAFMLAKEHTSRIIYHDANLPTHGLAFEIIAREWSGEWRVQRFADGEDGLALVSKLEGATT
jgi:methyltransferase family protein